MKYSAHQNFVLDLAFIDDFCLIYSWLWRLKKWWFSPPSHPALSTLTGWHLAFYYNKETAHVLYVSVYLFIINMNTRILSFQWFRIHYYTSLFWFWDCCSLTTVSPFKLAPASSDMPSPHHFFEHLLTFWHAMYKVHLVLLPQPWKEPRFLLERNDIKDQDLITAHCS